MSMGFGGDDYVDQSTMRGRDWPTLRQFCVILENRVGSLNELMRHLERHDLRVVALSIVDNVDVAIARVLLDQVERSRELFELSGFTFFENDVIGVELPDTSQPFVSVCAALLQAEVNLNYLYPLLLRRRRGAVAIHVEDIEMATQALQGRGFTLLNESDLQDEFFE